MPHLDPPIGGDEEGEGDLDIDLSGEEIGQGEELTDEEVEEIIASVTEEPELPNDPGDCKDTERGIPGRDIQRGPRPNGGG